jgi:phage tail-like protein
MTTLIERPLSAATPPELNPKPERRRSELLNYLPAMYATDDFMGRFLCIFEDTLKPLQQMAENFHYYFNPLMAPPDMIPWLATWVNLVLDESWSLEQRRKLIHNAADLYSRRGTKGGLIEYLKLYTGIEPEITEYVDGMVLGPETLLGVNTTIAGRERHSFTVTLRLQGLSEEERVFKEAFIRRIIEAEKPAHTAYRLNLLTNGNGKHNGADKGDVTATQPTGQEQNGRAAEDGNGSSVRNKSADAPRQNTEPKQRKPEPPEAQG